MEYQILIKDFPSCQVVHTIIKGRLSEVHRNIIAKETMEFCHKNNLSKVVWDIRETQLTYSLIGSHLIVEQFKDFGITKEDHIAIVYKNNAEQHKHTSTVVQNRGIINVKFFEDPEKGLQWLLGL